jgi:PBSX family phage terminase large subunit
MSDYNVFIPHSLKQQNAILSEAKTTLLCTGIQFGKTTAGSLWMKRLMHTYTDKTDNFIITSPNYKIMQQSTLPAFLKFMDGFGEYRKGDAIFEMHDGGVCYLRTATEPDSIVGITDVRGIWGDEAGKYSLYFWENMQARSSFKNCPIMLTTSPYSTNWVFKELIKPTKAGKREDVNLIQASSNENPHFPKEEFERRKRVMDFRRFAALYLGEFERMHGLVYDCFDDNIHQCDDFGLPSGTKYYAGVDWGHTDPFVIVVRAITPSGHHFQVSEFYKTRLTISDQIIAAKQKKQIFGIERFYADPSQPGSIEEFNRNGLPTVGADNDIRRGIDVHYELIRSGKFKIFKNTSPHSLDEYSTYHYPEPEDLDPDQDSKEALPVGQNDHSMDATRYVTISTVKVSTTKIRPKLPGDKTAEIMQDHEQRIKYLKKGRNKYPGSENW